MIRINTYLINTHTHTTLNYAQLSTYKRELVEETSENNRALTHTYTRARACIKYYNIHTQTERTL